jgi:hypothetical protein
MNLILSRALIVGGAALALGIGGGIAVAAIPSSDGTITACMAKPGGTIRLIDAEVGQTCKKGEQLLTWNQQGQSGQDGADGVSGYEQVSASFTRSASDPDTAKAFQVEVNCPEGKKVVGGGGDGTLSSGGFGTGLLDLVSSVPFQFENHSGWGITVGKPDGSFFTPAETADIRVRAICVSALP